MKKVFVLLAVTLAVTLVSCEKKTDYKALGEDLATQLDNMCKTDDVTGIIALDDSIRTLLDELSAQGDSASVNAFKAGLGDAQEKAAPIITVAKMQSGTPKEDAVQDVIDDALNGNGGDVETVAKSIKAALEQEKENGSKAAPK